MASVSGSRPVVSRSRATKTERIPVGLSQNA
jgi:hypothetical protein